MQLIIDANILFAAFLKSANTRKLLFNESIELFAPEYFGIEIEKHLLKDEVFRGRAGLTKQQTKELLSILLGRIQIIPEEEYRLFIKKTKGEVPNDDAPYLALSLSLNIPIWSNDAAFKNQKIAKVYTTSELLDILS